MGEPDEEKTKLIDGAGDGVEIEEEKRDTGLPAAAKPTKEEKKAAKKKYAELMAEIDKVAAQEKAEVEAAEKKFEVIKKTKEAEKEAKKKGLPYKPVTQYARNEAGLLDPTEAQLKALIETDKNAQALFDELKEKGLDEKKAAAIVFSAYTVDNESHPADMSQAQLASAFKSGGGKINAYPVFIPVPMNGSGPDLIKLPVK